MKRGRKTGEPYKTEYRYKVTYTDKTVKYYHTFQHAADDLGKTVLTAMQWLKKPYYTLHKYNLKLEKLDEPIKAQTQTIITHETILPTQGLITI